MYGYTPLYYGSPTQVKYLDLENKYRAGLCYHDFLIDCETGVVFGIDRFVNYHMSKRVPCDDIIVELEWKPMDIGNFKQN